MSLSVKDIFTHKNIERLSDQVFSKGLALSGEVKTEQGQLVGEVPLLPIQQWFFDHEFSRKEHWNQSFLIRTDELDIDHLRRCLVQLVEYQDSFRLRYKHDSSGKYVQFYNRDAKIEELKALDVRTLGAEEGTAEFNTQLHTLLTEWQSGFDLEKGPLWSVGYLYGYRDGSARVYFALHHLIVDAVSWRILAEDLKSLYEGKELGLKGSSYRQWVQTIQDYAKTHANEKTYWENVLGSDDASSLDRLIENQETRNIARVSLTAEETQQLLRESNQAYHTQVNDLLLTALGYALSELTGNRKNSVLLEGHGREEIDSAIDITRQLGWFTTLYPIRLELGSDLGATIKRVKENLREIPNKGIGYGALFGYDSKKLPRITFNYLGQFDQEK